MISSALLAQLIGLFSIAMGASMIIRRKMLMDIFKEIFSNRALSYSMGVAMLIIALLFVLQHNIWTGTTEVLITILGWAILFESLAYLFASQKLLKKYSGWLQNKNIYYLIAGAYLVLGGYLTHAGFFGNL